MEHAEQLATQRLIAVETAAAAKHSAAACCACGRCNGICCTSCQGTALQRCHQPLGASPSPSPSVAGATKNSAVAARARATSCHGEETLKTGRAGVVLDDGLASRDLPGKARRAVESGGTSGCEDSPPQCLAPNARRVSIGDIGNVTTSEISFVQASGNRIAGQRERPKEKRQAQKESRDERRQRLDLIKSLESELAVYEAHERSVQEAVSRLPDTERRLRTAADSDTNSISTWDDDLDSVLSGHSWSFRSFDRQDRTHHRRVQGSSSRAPAPCAQSQSPVAPADSSTDDNDDSGSGDVESPPLRTRPSARLAKAMGRAQAPSSASGQLARPPSQETEGASFSTGVTPPTSSRGSFLGSLMWAAASAIVGAATGSGGGEGGGADGNAACGRGMTPVVLMSSNATRRSLSFSRSRRRSDPASRAASRAAPDGGGSGSSSGSSSPRDHRV